MLEIIDDENKYPKLKVVENCFNKKIVKKTIF